MFAFFDTKWPEISWFSADFSSKGLFDLRWIQKKNSYRYHLCMHRRCLSSYKPNFRNQSLLILNYRRHSIRTTTSVWELLWNIPASRTIPSNSPVLANAFLHASTSIVVVSRNCKRFGYSSSCDDGGNCTGVEIPTTKYSSNQSKREIRTRWPNKIWLFTHIKGPPSGHGNLNITGHIFRWQCNGFDKFVELNLFDRLQ